MGMGKITDASETTGGLVHHFAADGAGLASAVASGASRTADVVAQESAFGQRVAQQAGADFWNVVGGIVGKIHEIEYEDPINKAEQAIRDYEREVRLVGYQDARGVRRPGVQTLSGKEAAGAAEAWDAQVAAEAQKISRAFNLNENQVKELQKRTHELRLGTRAQLAEWGALQAAGAAVVDAKVRYGKDLDRSVAKSVEDAKFGEDMIGSLLALGTTSEEAGKIRENAVKQSANAVADGLLAMRSSFVEDIRKRSLGKMSDEVANAYADEEMKKAGIAAVKSLAGAGYYDRSLAFVDKGEKIGFTESEKRQGREMVDDICRGHVATTVNSSTEALVEERFEDRTNKDGSVSPGIETSISSLRSLASKFPEGFRAKAEAIKAADELDRKADGIAAADCWKKIVTGVYGKKGDIETRPSESTREGRQYEKLYASYEKQMSEISDKATQEAQKATVAVFRASALDAAIFRPGEYMIELTKASKEGRITPQQFLAERQHFEETWAKVAPDKLRRMTDVLRASFPGWFASDDATGVFQMKSDGAFHRVSLAKDTKFVGFEYYDKSGKMRKLSADDVVALMDYGALLARHDGEYVFRDLETGEALVDASGKPMGRKIRASEDWQDFIGRLKTKNETRDAGELLRQRLRARQSIEADFAKAYSIAAKGGEKPADKPKKDVKQPK